MQTLRTPDDRFAGLTGFDLEPHYADVPDGNGGSLRMAWVQAGPADGEPIVLLHGEPTWGYLYRTMIDPLAGAGMRVVVPDLVGFGRSDKPTRIEDHTYARHVEWVRSLLFDVLDLRGLTVFGQDWGGLIGLRLVAEHADRFARACWSNTGLPTGDKPMPDVWHAFRRAMQNAPTVDVGRFVASGCRRPFSDAARAGYDAPFPDESFCAGPRAMPGLVPYAPDNPASEDNRRAWTVLRTLPMPTLVAFSDGDPITGAMGPVLVHRLPGAAGRQQPVVHDAGHFVQEDAGPELAALVAGFVASTPSR